MKLPSSITPKCKGAFVAGFAAGLVVQLLLLPF